MIPSEELNQIYTNQMNIVNDSVINFLALLIRISPVDTGAFRASWEIEQIDSTSWKITNDVEYATILWDGRRMVVGQWFGSEQWTEGGEVMLKRFNRELQKKLDRV